MISTAGATLYEIHPVPRTIVDAKLRHAFANSLHIAEQTVPEPHDPLCDSSSGSVISQAVEPPFECAGLTNLEHL